MKRLTWNILLIVLIILTSGCTALNINLSKSQQPKIDNNLPIIDNKSIKSISNIKSIALEWKGNNSHAVYGYYIFRSNLEKDGSKFTKIAKIKNKFASHYLDNSLKPNTQYSYAIATIGEDNMQSKLSKPIMTTTLNNFEPISFFIAISNLPRLIKILWRPHTSNAVKYYIIERSDFENPKWTQIVKIKHRLIVEYIDTKLKDNHGYSYRIKAVTFDNIESKYSEIIKAITKPLPESTNQIKATMNVARKIIVTWEPLKDNEIIAYNIYSSNRKNGLYTKIATAKKDDNTFENILNKNDAVRYYKITSVDKDNLETNKNSLPVAMGRTLELPAIPHITLGLIKDNTVIIKWVKGDNRAVYYNMYKTIKEGYLRSKSIVLKHIKEMRFEDKDISRGIDYEYQLEAVDENGLVSDRTKAILLNMPEIKKNN
jgi:fibronectin type 3 domain-containing protein